MFDQIKLADLADLAMGETIIAEDCDGKGFPIYSASTDEAPWNHSSHISRRLTPGTIVVGARGSIGFPRMPTAEKFGATQTTITVTSREGAVHPRFLFHALRNLDFKALTSQQAIPMLTVADLGAVSLPRPPLDEQAEIVGALDTLDTTIRQTEVIIEKLKQVKQGLLHDLLTRGIDANGELRPPQSGAPHFYKASPLGWIPTEWDVGPLESFLERIIDYRGKTPEKTESGITLITARNVRLGFLDPEPQEFIHASAFDSWMTRGIPKRGDILFTMEAPLGNVAQIEADERLAFAQRLVIMQAAQGISSTFLKYLLLGEGFRKKLFALGSGSTVEGIQQSTLRRIPIALPTSLNEQDMIARRLSELDRRIDSEAGHMEKSKSLKSGLMDDLLTGRVRVTPLLTQHATT